MTTIAVCMIVKNEEPLMPRCLASVAGMWDELIIVDTGSVDATVDIAAAHGATVLHYDWQQPGNKGAARQMGIDAASSDWIVVVDADEVVIHAEELRGLLGQATPEVDGVNVRFQNFDDAGQAVTLEWYQMRVFRRERWHYIHREHEIPVYLAGTAGILWTCPVTFEHRPPPSAGPGKVQTMLDRLRLDVEEHPDDPHSLYMYARQLGHAKRYDESTERINQYLAMPHSGLKSDACRLAAICCIDTGNRRGMYEWMHRATAYEPARRLLWAELARMYFVDGHHVVAEALARMALELPLPADQRETQPIEHTDRIIELIHACKVSRGAHD